MSPPTPTPNLTTLATLATLASKRFPTFAATTEAYLDIAAHLGGVRSAFIAHLDDMVMEVLGTWNDAGCAIPLNGVVPLEDTFCQYVRASGQPVRIDDAASDPRVANLATRRDFSIGAYLGVPLQRQDGTVFGSFCLVDPHPQHFTDDQLHALQVLAQQMVHLVEREVAVRSAVRIEREAAEDITVALAGLEEQTLLLRTLTHALHPRLTSILDATDRLSSIIALSSPAEHQHLLAHIYTTASSMHRLIIDLNDITVHDDHAEPLRLQAYSAADVLQQVSHLLAAESVHTPAQLDLQVEEGMSQLVGDPARVQQVLYRVLRHILAEDSTGAAAIAVRLVDTDVVYEVRTLRPVLEVRDVQGGPMTEVELQLYLARQLAQVMGGALHIGHLPTGGSSVSLHLPIRAR